MPTIKIQVKSQFDFVKYWITVVSFTSTAEEVSFEWSHHRILRGKVTKFVLSRKKSMIDRPAYHTFSCENSEIQI